MGEQMGMKNWILAILVQCAASALFGCSAVSVKTTHLSGRKDSVLKIVQLSDIHCDSTDGKFEEVVAKVNAIKPDLLLLTGDYVGNKRDYQAFVHRLRGIHVACPKFAILGNWEYWSHLNLDTLKQDFAESGIELLVNESRQILLQGRTINLFGLDDYLGGKPNLGIVQPTDASFNIVLAHCPVLFDAIVASKQIDKDRDLLVLSGHTHGGQVTFFGIPFKTPPGSGKYTAGLYKSGRSSLYVSRGIGNSVIKFRLFSPSTIELIEI